MYSDEGKQRIWDGCWSDDEEVRVGCMALALYI